MLLLNFDEATIIQKVVICELIDNKIVLIAEVSLE
jgi:hypothetical protein